MAKPVIEVQSLTKRYRLGVVGATTLREDLSRIRRRLFGEPGPAVPDEFWALRDVSFEIQPGEVVGVLGRNGAGKSTLLKILSRITEPTSGRAIMRGRVASLLEVGTGFHDDLTGRENVFLNGAILGMKRAEVASKFDEILEFAEVEKFIDTPVKHYSSGMRVRLAFAVAAHLDPEILIIDEVLAVGDAAFQRKCLGKMKDVAGNDGRTILFVSHNTAAVTALCQRAILLKKGSLDFVGSTSAALQRYLDEAVTSDKGEFFVGDHALRNAGAAKIIQKIVLMGADAKPTSTLFSMEPVTIELHCNCENNIELPRLAVAIEDNEGRRLMTLASYFEMSAPPTLSGRAVVRCDCKGLDLGPGRYLLSASVATKNDGLIDSLVSIARFEVRWRNNHPSGEPHDPVYGPMLRRSQWTVTPAN